MNAYDTLISPIEVKLHGFAGPQMDTTQMQSVIVVIEEGLFNQYFGVDFYTALFADKIDYSSALLFTGNTVYNVGDFVKLNGVTYECTQTTTGAQTPAQNADYFKVAPKFATEANEFLWHRYLGRILAVAVINEFAIPSAIKQTEKGLIRLANEVYNPASEKEIATYKQNAYQFTKSSIEVMEQYIMRNSANYPTYKKVQEESTSNCTPTQSTSNQYRRNTFGFVLPDPEDYPYDPYTK